MYFLSICYDRYMELFMDASLTTEHSKISWGTGAYLNLDRALERNKKGTW